eukprot:jgi/Orpsp1_1/1189180/evm.model.d7180000070059.1
MANSIDEKIIFIKKLIDKNCVNELKNFLKESDFKLNKLNHEEFDILLYSIENGSSLDTIDFIINECQYKNLNYVFNNQNENTSNDNSYQNCKIPLFSAIVSENFELADLLLSYKADVNYTLKNNLNKTIVDIISYLCDNHCLNNKKLLYILNHGFSIKNMNTKIINEIINYKSEVKNDLLDTIFHHYIFDNDFILNLLHFYKNKKLLSIGQLSHMITKEKTKIEINDTMYDYAVKTNYYKKNDIIYILFVYDGSDPKKITERIHHYKILETAIEKNDYYLVKRIINYNPWRFNGALNFEKILIKAIQKENVDIIKELMDSFNFKDFNFEHVLIAANQKRNCDIIILLINALLKYKYINTKQKINFREIVILIDLYRYLYYHSSSEKNIYGKSFKYIDFLIKTSLKNFSLDMNNTINIEDILFLSNFTNSSSNNNNNNNVSNNNNINNNNNNFELNLKYLLNTKTLNFNSLGNPIIAENLHPHYNTNDSINEFKLTIINQFFKSIINSTLFSWGQLDTTLNKEIITPYLSLILNMAIKLENINNVKYIIENTTKLNRNIIDINAKDSNGEYPIIVAYDHANSRAGEEIFAYLLKHGASINVKTRQGITLLRDALQNRKYRVLKHILNYPLSLDEKEVTNKYYAFPLIKAIYHNNFEEVRSIAMKNNYRLDVYTYTNIRIDYSKCLFTPLILAYLLDYKEIFQFLIKYADINALDSHGYRLLHYVILREDIDTIDYLITHGAD